MYDPQVGIWEDIPMDCIIVEIKSGLGGIRVPIPREALHMYSKRDLIRNALEVAAVGFERKFRSHPIKVNVPEEGEAWSVHFDKTIDGEIVMKEIEGAPGS